MLINKQNVKALALLCSQEERLGHFTRVSNAFLLRMDRALAVFIRGEVRRHPSRGVTIK